MHTYFLSVRKPMDKIKFLVQRCSVDEVVILHTYLVVVKNNNFQFYQIYGCR